MTTTKTLRRGLWACVPLLLAGGCADDLLKSDAPAAETFRLTVAAPTLPAGTTVTTSPVVAMALVVALPRAVAALDTDRIAVAATSNRFDYYSDARWAETAPQMLQANIVTALAGSGRFAGVLAAPARVPAELLLDVELRRFEAVSPGVDASAPAAVPVAHVQVQASLVDARRGVRVTSFISEAAVPASENRLGAVIDAFERANAQVVLDISARVQDAAVALPAK